MKICKTCKAEFVQYNTIQTLCTSCLIVKGRKIAIKNAKTVVNTQKRELKAQKDAIKTRADWLKEAQQAVNAWVRARDHDLPCISCQRHHEGQYHAGHYRTTKAAPELRFDERNLNKQCSACNNHLSGNILEYRINLIKKIGIEKVEELEGNHPPKKYTIPELQAIKAEYKERLKRLQNS